MHRSRLVSLRVRIFCVLASLACSTLLCRGQKAPASPQHPWDESRYASSLHDANKDSTQEFRPSATEVYSLGELIDLAEQHNPQTRSAWQAAKAQAAQVGVARSDLYPTVTANALALTSQNGVLLYNTFVQQVLGIGQAQVGLSYTVFDSNARLDRVARARASLLAANFGFNDVHRRLIFQTMTSYYQLLNANGQRKAAEANLQNAHAVQAAAEARLEHGLATLPDVLEARSATAQAEYDLQSTIGAEQTATGDLATALMASPSSELHVQAIDALTIPGELSGDVQDLMQRALAHRPDLLARLADVRGAEARVKEARSAYYPRVNLQGTYGYLKAYGEQLPFDGTYARAPVYNVQLNIGWTAFDGGRRRNDLAQAKAEEKQAQARVEETRDQISNEVWRSYADTTTALRQRAAAAALLNASGTSYQAALESYNYGVRNILDVLSSQRALAQARSQDIAARTRVLSQFADLAYRTADLLRQNPASAPRP